MRKKRWSTCRKLNRACKCEKNECQGEINLPSVPWATTPVQPTHAQTNAKRKVEQGHGNRNRISLLTFSQSWDGVVFSVGNQHTQTLSDRNEHPHNTKQVHKYNKILSILSILTSNKDQKCPHRIIEYSLPQWPL